MVSHWGISLDAFAAVNGLDIALLDLGAEVRISPQDVHRSRIRFVAPEQLKISYQDAKTDVYAMGMILYRLYTGSYPFPDKSAEKIHQWHRNANRKTMVFPEHIHLDLQRVIQKSLAIEPMLRYDSVKELKRDFCEATSQLGWFIFERSITEDLQQRSCLSHILCDDSMEDFEVDLQLQIGDIFPTWRMYRGTVLLSIDPCLFHNQEKSFDQTALETIFAQRPISYDQIKIAQYLGAVDISQALISVLTAAAHSSEDFLLLAVIHSSVLLDIYKADQLAITALEKSTQFDEKIQISCFSRWHLQDKRFTKKVLDSLRSSTLCPDELLVLSQAYWVLLNNEEEMVRYLNRFISYYAKEEIQEQIFAIQRITTIYGARPELIRWTVRIEGESSFVYFQEIGAIWETLDVPKRAQKIERRYQQEIQQAVLSSMQKLYALGISLPEYDRDNLEECQRVLAENTKLLGLEQKKQELISLAVKHGLHFTLETLKREEHFLLQWEEELQQKIAEITRITESRNSIQAIESDSISAEEKIAEKSNLDVALERENKIIHETADLIRKESEDVLVRSNRSWIYVSIFFLLIIILSMVYFQGRL